ncbi:MAG TPA: phospho-N-acetylmuramoyl-pentapeptide-transferase [Pyrinomonadaceae bacterium]|jgi:phospho-N-acetylmuramoyl-pentapeptide-transferase|nr:phospho-N-acetylmuramoyl-pentapeptide-transferase [Pyrinomonadaceae bacterium]
MFYYILYELIYGHFKDQDWYLVKALNVFQYVTFRTAYASITAMLISLLFGGRLVEALKKWNIGQQIREEGPQAHMAKRDTPTMGGLLIIASVIISTLMWARLNGLYIWITILATLGFGAIGFADDYIKLVRRRSLGLTGKQKIAFQLLIAVLVWGVLYISTQYFATKYSWNVSIPFFKSTADPNPATSISYIGPYLYLVLIVGVLLGTTNGVNLTDGLDGLAISITFIAMGALTAFTYLASDSRWATYLDLTHRPEAAELTVFCGAMAGASLGFLWFNAPPAEVFMGDVGSLAIGGAVGTIAVLTKQEFMLVMVGGVFVIEALSVMLQVGVFKFTKRTTGVGKRVFKMTPLHHHFEMVGWKESKIVFRFLILAILFALLSLSTLKLR